MEYRSSPAQAASVGLIVLSHFAAGSPEISSLTSDRNVIPPHSLSFCLHGPSHLLAGEISKSAV